MAVISGDYTSGMVQAHVSVKINVDGILAMVMVIVMRDSCSGGVLRIRGLE